VATDHDWAAYAKALIRDEMIRQGVTYPALSQRLGVMGVKITDVALRNKLSRTGFSAAFLLQALRALGVGELSLRTAPDAPPATTSHHG
jgi:hypothetical protein